MSHPQVTLSTTLWDITLELYPEYAPKAVENFVTHAKNGYYDGIIFHRVIRDFMIQCGDPTGTGRGWESIWGRSFEDEFTYDLSHKRGVISMANAGRNTNGSQFFIVTAEDASFLDRKHSIFWHVIAGMEVVDAIEASETDRADRPLEDVVIVKASIIE
jgi:cyclophilin family peptidyl-prolyl cis-trans isomerase